MVRQKQKARGRPREKTSMETEYLYELGIAGMSRVRAERAADRWRKALQRAKRYGFPPGLKVVEHMEAALTAMEKTAAALGKVPETWKPAVGAVGNQLIEQGARVQIREGKRGVYFYLTDPSEPFEVAAVQGSKIMCLVPAGKTGTLTQTLFPRAHIQLVHEEA